ncbi:AraC family transcriptional regulator [Leptospira sp. 201903075]|uniref:helix-turn-helix domain-containing protein n=1 Tax=Leptospira chreensis TaxID=2810035 RepID=UPI00196402B8|nr:helix-turn-helix domain-containing protein [Leptospira chreensis]MBM9590558.1 AraC family transcriptional regulator [Leptospira chreensis]
MKVESISLQIAPKLIIALIATIGILISSQPYSFLLLGFFLLMDWKWIQSFLEIPHPIFLVIEKNKTNMIQSKEMNVKNSFIDGKKYSLFKGLDLKEQRNKLDGLMNQERLYLDEELRLPRLAEEMNLSLHCLSALLNDHIGKGFNEYVNEFRIVEAKKMLLSEKNRSVLSIGLAVGFNSYSAFLKSFKNIENITPVKFRKDLMFL